MVICSFANQIIITAFVTGNANKLKEVKAILSEGGNPIAIDSQSLDSESMILVIYSYPLFFKKINNLVPEIQGTTQEVAIDKCKRAAELVCVIVSSCSCPNNKKDNHSQF